MTELNRSHLHNTNKAPTSASAAPGLSVMADSFGHQNGRSKIVSLADPYMRKLLRNKWRAIKTGQRQSSQAVPGNDSRQESDPGGAVSPPEATTPYPSLGKICVLDDLVLQKKVQDTQNPIWRQNYDFGFEKYRHHHGRSERGRGKTRLCTQKKS